MSAAEGQPTEEELREYAKQMRVLPAERVVGDTLMSLLSCAQTKLGRRDARLMIDLAAITVEHARDHLPADLTKQVDDMLGQLRLAQVNAEGQNSGREAEENDLDRLPAPPAGGQQSASAAQSAPQPSATSKLWVPGR